MDRPDVNEKNAEACKHLLTIDILYSCKFITPNVVSIQLKTSSQ